jgi:hypothetical protein
MWGPSATAAGPTSTTRAASPSRSTSATPVETIYQESVPEGADAERAITQMVLSGAGLIFTTSFGFMDATVNVAEQFPDVKFEHATGYKRLDNLATYDAAVLRGARGDRPHRGPHDQDQQDRLHRLLPDPRGDPGHQLGLPATPARRTRRSRWW